MKRTLIVATLALLTSGCSTQQPARGPSRPVRSLAYKAGAMCHVVGLTPADNPFVGLSVPQADQWLRGHMDAAGTDHATGVN